MTKVLGSSGLQELSSSGLQELIEGSQWDSAVERCRDYPVSCLI